VAYLTPFVYRPGSGFLHALDPRARFLAFALLSAACFLLGTLGNCLFIAAILVLGRISGLSLKDSFRGILPLLPVLAIVILFQGVSIGILYSLRLTSVALLTALFMSTTSVTDIRNVVSWASRPFPPLRAIDLDLLVALLFSWLPVIFERSERVRAAQSARCIEGRNPVRRAAVFTRVLLSSLLRSAGTTASALESRAYCRDRTLPSFTWGRAESLAATASLAVLAAALFLARG
jgi:energy-coupling factor transporter transmembrane protein EcfT